ncbi:hypothetical protein A2872_02870 [Candidatus Gottesmanbacteria bacterium RIFCSPHIGHO2_01_FULL_42_12]|uniref:Glycosyltransferase 2-like domain-containing protein n=1 Tax=Candidatus Gottesmanbacteria bacterium RIFCSPHIGHO2_01_FULL_42_12 TaxID=1798377 RepID=A0A1F5Z3U0_9BACT|nr:MAG: hypothetical protein A2872_02870 [Candidatus Gottesmanbacteria bacterium RIFCSPHIGHO2_01_FULL_42_12]
MKKSFKLSVLMPVFNEVKTIDTIVKRVLKRPEVYELIIVDDGSTDGTTRKLTMKDKRVKIIFKRRNEGKGAAIITALERATGTHVIIQDADLEYDPDDYQQMVKPILNGNAEVVYGSRFIGPHRDMLFWHKVGNDLINFSIDILFDSIISDCETGYKLIPVTLLKSLKLEAKRFDFEIETTCKILKRGIRIYEVPISYTGREYKDGKKIGFKDGIIALLRVWQYRLFV